MPNISILFWVRASSANKKGFAPLMIRISLPGGDVIDFSSGNKVEVKLWDSVRKSVKGKSTEAERINKYILSSEIRLLSIYDKLTEYNQFVSSEMIKNVFTGKAQERITVLSAIDAHNRSFKSRIDQDRKGSEYTLAMYKGMKDKIMAYMETINRKDLFVSEIDYGFLEGFRLHLSSEGKDGKSGLGKDTVAGVLKKLKKITTELFKRGNLKSDPFVGIDLSSGKSQTEGISEADINKLLDIEAIDPSLQASLDRAIVGSFSGMGHQDLSSVKKSDIITNIDGNKWIRIRRVKTGELCNIPVLPPVEMIIDKYKDMPGENVFPEVDINTCNNQLKRISKIAGLSITLTTHKLRHGFAQMSFDSGMDIEALASILGHANSSVTRSVYARSSMKLVSLEVEKFKDKKFPGLKINTKNTG